MLSVSMNYRQSRVRLLWILAWALSLLACESSEPQGFGLDSPPSVEVMPLSFLTEASFFYRSIRWEDRDPDLTYLSPGPVGTWDAAFNELPTETWISAGGIQNQLGESYEFLAGAPLNSIPVARFTSFSTSGAASLLDFYLVVRVNQDRYCIFPAQKSGVLQLVSISTEESRMRCEPLVGNVYFNRDFSGIDVSIFFGELRELDLATASFVPFFRSRNAGDLWQGKAINGYTFPGYTANGPVELLLAMHSNQPSALPPRVIGDGGFLPNPDGFGYQNAGLQIREGVLGEEFAIALYGRELSCYKGFGRKCTLTAFARGAIQVLSNQNGGQCFGMSVASSMLKYEEAFDGKTRPSDYNPAITAAIGLGQTLTGRQVAFYQASQQSLALRRNNLLCSQGAPSEIVQRVLDGFGSEDPIVALTFENARGGDGHAVTPYAVTEEEDSIRRIYIYDNNYPADPHRFIEVDLDLEEWRYATAINSGAAEQEYRGSATANNSLCAVPMSVSQDVRVYTAEEDAIMITGLEERDSLELQIVDPEGNVSGWNFATGKRQNQIPGAEEIAGGDVETTYSFPLPDRVNPSGPIESREDLDLFLDSSYSLTFGPAGTESPQASDNVGIAQTAIDETASSALSYMTQFVSELPSLQVLVNSSGRFVSLPEKRAGDLNMNFDDRLAEEGWSYMITLPPSELETQLAFLLDEEGTLNGYRYSKSSFSILDLTSGTISILLTRASSAGGITVSGDRTSTLGP